MGSPTTTLATIGRGRQRRSRRAGAARIARGRNALDPADASPSARREDGDMQALKDLPPDYGEGLYRVPPHPSAEPQVSVLEAWRVALRLASDEPGLLLKLSLLQFVPLLGPVVAAGIQTWLFQRWLLGDRSKVPPLTFGGHPFHGAVTVVGTEDNRRLPSISEESAVDRMRKI